jgi:hypothetical protein
MAIYNPCFELWLLLHHQNAGCEITDARQAIAMLRRHIPDYDKTRLAFDDYRAGLANAIRRAQALHGDCATCGPNPSSTVWVLARTIAPGTGVLPT